MSARLSQRPIVNVYTGKHAGEESHCAQPKDWQERVSFNGQVVAGLSFGFWVGMLQRRYNPPIWSKHLRHSFPFLPPKIGRDDILDKARKVATLRNRISHHEPLISRDISGDYANVMEFLGWLCPTKIKWIRTHCRLPEVLRQKP
jgi:hypothetical protein